MLKGTDIGFIGLAQGSVIPTSKTENHSQVALESADHPVLSEDGKTLYAAVQVRGQVIGKIRLSKPEQASAWNTDEISVIGALTSQLSNAVESARLYEEAQRRATNERQTAAIVNQIRSSSVTSTILQNTIRELGKTLGATRTYIQISVPSTDQNSPSKKKVER